MFTLSNSSSHQNSGEPGTNSCEPSAAGGSNEAEVCVCDVETRRKEPSDPEHQAASTSRLLDHHHGRLVDGLHDGGQPAAQVVGLGHVDFGRVFKNHRLC